MSTRSRQEYLIEYREKNKDKIKEQRKIYREKNKDKIKEQNKLRVECVCGANVSKASFKRHLTSNNHSEYIRTGVNQYFTCNCGKRVAKTWASVHERYQPECKEFIHRNNLIEIERQMIIDRGDRYNLHHEQSL